MMEVAIIETKISKDVISFLEDNYGYDLSNETPEQREYRIQTIYATMRVMDSQPRIVDCLAPYIEPEEDGTGR